MNLEEIYDYNQLDETFLDESSALRDSRDEYEKRKQLKTETGKTSLQSIVDLLKKYDGQNLFISFRDTIHTGMINPKNTYNTPTGFYSYPLSIMAKKALVNWGLPINDWDSLLKIDEHQFFSSIVFPFKASSEFMVIFHLKTNDGVFYSSNLNDSRIPEYVDRIKNIYSDVERIQKECDIFLKTNTVESNYVGSGEKKEGVWGLWLLIYNVQILAGKSKLNDQFTLLCHKIGINGFVDDAGLGMIHRNEPTQAVFLRHRTIFDDVIHLSKQKGTSFPQKISGNMTPRDVHKNSMEAWKKFSKFLLGQIRIILNINPEEEIKIIDFNVGMKITQGQIFFVFNPTDKSAHGFKYDNTKNKVFEYDISRIEDPFKYNNSDIIKAVINTKIADEKYKIVDELNIQQHNDGVGVNYAIGKTKNKLRYVYGKDGLLDVSKINYISFTIEVGGIAAYFNTKYNTEYVKYFGGGTPINGIDGKLIFKKLDGSMETATIQDDDTIKVGPPEIDVLGETLMSRYFADIINEPVISVSKIKINDSIESIKNRFIITVGPPTSKYNTQNHKSIVDEYGNLNVEGINVKQLKSYALTVYIAQKYKIKNLVFTCKNKNSSSFLLGVYGINERVVDKIYLMDIEGNVSGIPKDDVLKIYNDFDFENLSDSPISSSIVLALLFNQAHDFNRGEKFTSISTLGMNDIYGVGIAKFSHNVKLKPVPLFVDKSGNITLGGLKSPDDTKIFPNFQNAMAAYFNTKYGSTYLDGEKVGENYVFIQESEKTNMTPNVFHVLVNERGDLVKELKPISELKEISSQFKVVDSEDYISAYLNSMTDVKYLITYATITDDFKYFLVKGNTTHRTNAWLYFNQNCKLTLPTEEEIENYSKSETRQTASKFYKNGFYDTKNVFFDMEEKNKKDELNESIKNILGFMKRIS